MNFQPHISFEPISVQQAHQLEALKETLQNISANSNFYKELFRQHNVNINRIKSLQDLSDLPFTHKENIQQHNEDFICVAKSDIREYTATSGTLGKPVTIALTENDLQRLAYNESQSFLIADGKPEDIYQLMLTLDRQFMAGAAYYSGIRKMGAAAIRTGPGLPAMQWEIINRLKTTSLVAVPSFLVKMADYAQQHKIAIENTAVTKAICIGESLRKNDFSLNALGEKISDHWNIKLYSTYASTEMQTAFTECGAGCGGHEQADLLITEIIDDAGNPLPAGQYGEVTITTLGIEGMPLLRYRTGDVCAYYHERCTCGRYSKRLSPVMGRKKQMLKYKGTTLYPPVIFDVLNGVSYIEEYIVEAFSSELGLDEIRIHLHTNISNEACEQKLKPVFQSGLRVIPSFQFHSSESIQKIMLPEAGRKQTWFLDNRI